MHRNLVAGVLEALEWSFGKDLYADKVLEQLFRQRKQWGKRDRAFVAEHTYTIVRNWRLLWSLMQEDPKLKRKSLWKLFHVYALWRGLSLPEWDDFQEETPPPFDQIENWPLPIRESYPEWLSQRAAEEIGEHWESIAVEMNREAALVLRTNTLRTNRAALISALENEGLQPQALPWNDVGVLLDQRVATQRLGVFQKGWFEVQDGGSQQIAPLLDAQKGMTVIDACAGAGGKSLHLAALMDNSGQMISMDVEARKLAELEKRAKRQGVDIIQTRLVNVAALKELHNSADRLLLDVPCSGTGVIKRKPDTKWKLKPEYLENVLQTQAEILRSYSGMLKSGGKMVYATCSILPSENQWQVQAFLDEAPDFQLIHQESIVPTHGSDGYFMALLQKA